MEPRGVGSGPDIIGEVMVLAWAGCQLFSRGGRCEHIASPHPRPSVHGEEAHPTGGGLVFSEHIGSGGINLEK
jgi:hypothetical protein